MYARFRLLLVIVTAFLVGAAVSLALNFGSLTMKGGSTSSTGKALIGGPFVLVDHTGKRVTDKDFLGRYMLVYFGYTYCPDVCPTELQVMTAALNKLGPLADRVTPVFITVDPERDTVEQMASYVTNFHPRLIGLTGSVEQVRAAAKAYRVYYAKTEDSSATDYLIDHSSFVYLMNPRGEYVTHFPYGLGSDKMAAQIRKHLTADNATAALGAKGSIQ